MRRYYQEIRWYLKFVFRRYIAKSEWKMILNRTESIVVMSCGVYGNYDSGWVDGTMDTECVSLWPMGVSRYQI